MAKKNKSNYTNDNSKEYVVQKLHEANPDIPIEEIRYAVMNDVSTPEAMIPYGPGYTNPAIFRLLDEKKANSNVERAKEIDKWPKIPYIEDKEIMLRSGLFNTGRISTNVLDSLYDASKRVGVPFETALGLAGRESTLGIGRGFKRGKSISPTALMSNWQQVQDIINTNYDGERADGILKRYYNNEVISQDDIDFLERFYDNEQREIESTRPITENPIDNALKYFMEGKYNPGDPKHTKMVEADSKTLINDPAIIKWRKENNKYGWGGDFIKGLGLDDLKDTFSGTNVGGALKEGLGAIGQIAGKGASSLISGGLQSGAGNAITGVTGTIGSAIGAVNPVLGGIVSIGGGIIGGVTNQLFGSKLNKEKIAGVESDINRAMNYTSNAGDYDALASNYMGLQGIQGFDKRAIGKDGLFSNKAKNKFNELREQADIAEQWQYNVLANNAQNIADTNLQLLEANYSAYGGPIDMKYTGVMSPFGNQFKDGGIFIKPSKRGTFTAAANKRGMGVQEFASKVLANKEDYSPAMVKKANFARNASKWKHDDGGPLNPYSAGALVDAIYSSFKREEHLGKPSHNYDFTIPEEEANKLGYYPDERGHRDDRVKKPTHPTHPSRGKWKSFEEFELTDRGMENPNYILFGLNDGGQDPQAVMTYNGGIVLPEITVTPKGSYIMNPYDNIKIFNNGGSLEKDNLFTNGVTTIGNGGTHEQNPYEGVQMGVDPQGIPNLVEEGEVIWNDYVFSNRLRVPKEVRQKYKLRDITFADAAKQLQKESEERPNDPISKNGLNAAMTMLQQEQEATRMKKESNKYAKGGKLGRIYDGTEGDPNWLYKPVTPGFVPSKDDVLALMEDTFPFLTETPELTQKDREMLGKDLISYINREEKVKPIRTNWLRYSPIVGSGLAVLNDWFGGNEPDYTNANMFARAIEGTNRPIRARQIGNYLTYRPLDRDFYINKLNANTSASRRALANTSGGNRAAAMAGLLAADYNYGNQLGDLARKAVEYDLAQRQAVEEFNRGTSVSNAEMAMKADMANAEQDMQRARLYGNLAEYRDKILAANRAEKAANLTNFIQGLGDLGKELSDRDMVRWLYEKGVLKAANGGKINRKKRGGFTI